MAKVTLDTNAVTVPATNGLSKMCSNVLSSVKRALGLEEKKCPVCLVATSAIVFGVCGAAYVYLSKKKKK